MKSKFEIVECARCEKKFRRMTYETNMIACIDCWKEYQSSTMEIEFKAWCKENRKGKAFSEELAQILEKKKT